MPTKSRHQAAALLGASHPEAPALRAALLPLLLPPDTISPLSGSA